MHYLLRPLAWLWDSLVVSRGSVADDYEYERGDYAAAMREWLPLAKQRLAVAQCNVGIMYNGGEGVPENDCETVKMMGSRTTPST